MSGGPVVGFNPPYSLGGLAGHLSSDNGLDYRTGKQNRNKWREKQVCPNLPASDVVTDTPDGSQTQCGHHEIF